MTNLNQDYEFYIHIGSKVDVRFILYCRPPQSNFAICIGGGGFYLKVGRVVKIVESTFDPKFWIKC